MSDVLSCDFADFDRGGLALYGVICGDIDSNHGWGDDYPFKHQPNPPKIERCTALWSGFRSIYELRANGRLYLVSYTYPFSEQESSRFEEQLEGDFWLVMKSKFHGDRTYIPFVNDEIIIDKKRWMIKLARSLKQIMEKEADKAIPWKPSD